MATDPAALRRMEAQAASLSSSGGTFSRLPQPVQQRVVLDITASTLIGEATNALFRAKTLLELDTGHSEDEDGAFARALQCDMALKVLSGAVEITPAPEGGTP